MSVNLAVLEIKRKLTQLDDDLKQVEAQHKREVEFYEERSSDLKAEIASWQAVLEAVDKPAEKPAAKKAAAPKK